MAGKNHNSADSVLLSLAHAPQGNLPSRHGTVVLAQLPGVVPIVNFGVPMHEPSRHAVTFQ